MAAVAGCSMALPIPHSGIYTQSSGTRGIHGLQRKASSNRRRGHLQASKAAGADNQAPKPKSVICTDCDGNGAVQCSQCKGSGVNPVDFFNGQFKAGDSCWLCGGKQDMLCGNCNGAGFIGGFMSTFDE
ncbi:unnamed protein product [Linum tenue]|uniref:BSD2 cysteine rich domain-containing protein n=1 Tax=Linum tenue TaxID=586396 RepID=A0AAV0K2I0_9ROSI|nr:unnamed protein product [Linum tenue]